MTQIIQTLNTETWGHTGRRQRHKRRRLVSSGFGGYSKRRSNVVVAGIDPGASGGVSFHGNGWVNVEKLPSNAKELMELLKTESPDVAYVEQIYLPNGKAGALNFAAGWGKVLGVLEILEIETVLVRPQVWMKDLDCMTKGDKNITKQKAKDMFGEFRYTDGKGIPITHWSSDALLIGHYGFRKERMFNG
jgi:hypothetical protein